MNLIGKTTPGGWQIVEAVPFPPDQTGGYFSACFYVTKDGRKAFLKALDIEKFDVAQLLEILAGFKYETELLDLCNGKRLARVVNVLESGRIERDPNAPTVLRFAPFLIFELADGDIRRSVDVSTGVSNQWRFFVLHQTTLALLQLHGQSIAHQDLKPSNVLQFPQGRLKIGDLGRSSLRGKPSPHDNLVCAGALNYAPFEHRYGSVATDWIERRLSTDVFHLGCLAVFVFTNVCFPEFVMQYMAEPYRPKNWGLSYAEVMPHLRAAMVEALNDLSKDFPTQFRPQLIEVVKDLCEPEPSSRGRLGVNKSAVVGLLWLQRYASKFDILEKTARLRVPGAKSA